MTFLAAALQLTPTVVAAGDDIAAFVAWALAVHNSGTDPTAADWETLNAKEATLRATLDSRAS
ncbi:MAG: hypothetical protein M0006_16080 [Magnetospirillum sp.]|nr:hypothetical protein [Magnetospirillum sp.]